MRLRSSTESVSVSLAEGEDRHGVVRGDGVGDLFDRVLGRVIHALGAHCDNLMVDRSSLCRISMRAKSGCVVPAAYKQLQRTVVRHRGDAASAPFHYALASRVTRQRAAAELRR